MQVRKFIRPECLNLPFVLFSNFELSAALKARLQAVVAECASGSSTGEPERAWDGHSMAAVLRMQDECLELFQHEAAAAQRADAQRKGA